jgi:hypothetical protein
MANESLGKDLLLVRLQDDVQGARHDGKQLTLVEGRERNTMHFAVNSVPSPGLGGVKHNPDGTFAGQVAIIANAREMPTPAGWGQADSWFRLRGERDANGALQRNLPLGDATVVAPVGTQVPGGVRAVFYEGGPAQRDAAIRQVFAERGVEMRSANQWGWNGHNIDQHEQWRKTTADQLWPGQRQHIHLGPYQGSMDERFARADMGGVIEEMRRGNRFHATASGAEVPYADVGRQRVDEAARDLRKLVFDGTPPRDRSAVAPVYEAHLQRVERQLGQVQDLDRKLLSQAPAQAAAPPDRQAQQQRQQGAQPQPSSPAQPTAQQKPAAAQPVRGGQGAGMPATNGPLAAQIGQVPRLVPEQGARNVPASKDQLMNAMRSGLKAMNLDANSAQRVLSRLSERLDGMLAKGQALPSLGRFDMTAVSQLPAYTARQVQQGVSQQIGQPRPGRGR